MPIKIRKFSSILSSPNSNKKKHRQLPHNKNHKQLQNNRKPTEQNIKMVLKYKKFPKNHQKINPNKKLKYNNKQKEKQNNKRNNNRRNENNKKRNNRNE